MNRGLAVLVMAMGAAMAWAGYSDNTVMNVLESPFNKTVTLNKGSKGLDEVIAAFTAYLVTRFGLPAFLGGLGGQSTAGGSSEEPSEPTEPEIPIEPAATGSPSGTLV